jgi:hypothetical protein
MNSQKRFLYVKTPNVMLGLAFIAAVGLSFAVGESLGQRSMVKQMRINLDGVQAMLLADQIVERRKVRSFLIGGCRTEALEEIDFTENAEMKLLAEFVTSNLDKSSLEYINSRNPNFLDEIRTFKSKYPSKRPEVSCMKSS